jgi:carbamate kinase
LPPLACEHEVVLTHGNGPQVGLLALESAADPALSAPYPLDVLGAQTQGMIGYWLLQGLGNALPTRRVAALINQTLVSPIDPAFLHPTKFVGQVYDGDTAHRRAAELGWTVAPDGAGWRRVVPSPEPEKIVETPVIKLLLAAGAIVVCAGGGGAPVVLDPDGHLRGVEAVVDKDLTSAVLAQALDADALLMLTDVPAVVRDFGLPGAQPIHRTTPGALRQMGLPAGSMGPKADAACRFVEAGGKLAAIGALDDAVRLLDGTAGTVVTLDG